MRIPESKVDEIYAVADIVEVVADYVSLKKKGANFWALSPFTNEKTPSFAVSPAKGIYKCFSTGKGGNSVNFIMEMEGLSYAEALRHLAKRYHIELPEEAEPDSAQLANQDHRQSLLIVNEFAANWFHRQLLDTEEGRQIGLSYFKERGLLEASLETFQLGYAPDAWDAFGTAAIAQQFQESYLVELGLCGLSEQSGNRYDRFKGRVIFPIHNAMGKVVGFAGRILKGDKSVAKYINSPESPIYHKSQILYGLHQARQHIRNEDQCILTEGYLDVISLWQNGIRNTVASSGTALTVEQIRLIRRFTRRVLMIYDGDAAGIKAALRGIDLLLEEEMEIRVLILPDGHDPDSYVREKGGPAFKEYAAEHAQGFAEFKLTALRGQYDAKDPQQQAALIRELAATVARIPDELQRQLFIRHTAALTAIEEGLMARTVQESRREIEREQQRDARRSSQFETVAQEAEVRELRAFDTLDLARQEKELLRLLLNHYDAEFVPRTAGEQAPRPLAAFLTEELSGYTFENTVYERLKEEIFAGFRQGQTLPLHRYLTHEDAAICSLVADLLTVPHTLSEHWRSHGISVPALDENLAQAVDSAVHHYQRKRIGKLLDELRNRMKNMQQEEEEELFEMLMYLNNLRTQVTRKLGIIVEG